MSNTPEKPDDPATSAAATPGFFGPNERLFGWEHPPSETACRGGVVLVNPFGYEAICAHRAYKKLAEQLSRAGFWALRFDLDGTGDSLGDDRDGPRVAAWVASIDAAVDLAKARGVGPVTLFGVRLGALLALAAASRRDDVAAVIALAPIASGRAYTRELKAFRRMAEKGAESGAPPRGRGERDEEAAGFLLSEATLAELGDLDASRLQPRCKRALVVARDDVPSGEAKLVARLTEVGVDAALDATPGYGKMMTEPHNSAVPTAVFDACAAWLEASFEPDAARRAAPAPSPLVSTRVVAPARSSADVELREFIVRFGAGQGLFGILTTRSDRVRAASADDATVLVTNAGCIHHIGPNRMAVPMANHLAAKGAAVLRFDASGIGDSAALRGGENRTYARDGVGDLQAAMDHVTATRGPTSFVLTGLCSGAYVSFHTAVVDARPVAALLINPQTFVWREGDTLEVSHARNYNDVQHYRSSMFRLDAWKKALRGDVDFQRILRTLASRARHLADTRGRRLLSRFGRGDLAEDDVPGALRELSRRRFKLLMYMSAGDPGLDYLDGALGAAARRPSGGYALEVVEGADHTFTPLWSQTTLIDRMDQFVDDLPKDGRSSATRS